MNKYLHLKGMGCDPLMLAEFDSLKREKRKLFSEQMGESHFKVFSTFKIGDR